MHKLLNIPFLVLTLSLITGIIIGYYSEIELKLVLTYQIIAITGLLVSWWYAKKIFKSTVGFSVLVIMTFTFFGITIVKINNPKHNSNYYTNLIKNDKNPNVISFHIKERLKPSTYYEKYIVNITSINQETTQGKLLIQIAKDSLNQKLTIGDSYVTFETLKPIATALNPNQFDYADFLSKQYVFHKINLKFEQLKPTDLHVFSIYRIAHLIRTDIHQNLASYNFNKKQLSIINALLLGQRQDIDSNTFNDYRDAGAIHILAVSGLHIGILLLILNSILKPLNHFRKNGKVAKTIFIILILWCFAVIAGLSPSVLRAVTMFSFIAIGMHIRSKTSIYNSLIVSMFALLCVRPLLLFSIGFQLSYLAVFAIVWIQPSLAKLYTPRFYIDTKLWETFTVTIAAQLGLLPLLLFYFHQFPLLFFISNLIIIPVLGIILGFGIIVIFLAEMQLLTDWIALIFGNFINAMNFIVYWVSKQEIFIITNIYFSFRMLITGYSFIISLIFTLKKTCSRNIITVLISSVLFLSTMIYERHLNLTKEELIVFHNYRNTTLGVLQNQYLRLFTKDSVSITAKNYLLKNYLIENNSKLHNTEKLNNIYHYKTKTILVIDSSSIYQIKKIHPDIIILTNSPKIHLDRVIQTLKPKLIVADGSNYKSYLDQWEKNCVKQNIPFHRTDKKGAFILN
ncbi:competence protein ComEC [Aquimarina amphilecti]|uniref:Competence protein ComEC n=1 Tax=Aquimarina amphilecti TaxID=1038014 RepID=A0A1H7NKH4_AQUAM|nr:ComEC/Rec2 family competence protein [Aquimarina amphilecti]SEL23525.1 competence protein ComEC [Aquimarina amphilecti]